MSKYIKHLSVLTIMLSVSFSFSQERENDTIDTDVVNVVKPYSPTISDAFKVKETPTLDDEETSTKKEVKYNIFSIPVASTFTPAKGKAADVEKLEKEKLFDNYASIGVGTYTTILGELYLNHAINNTESVGGYINHHSSQGGIEDLLLDDAFSDSKININYKKSLNTYSWNLEAGYRNQSYNWYGLDQSAYDQTDANSIDPKHTFNTVHLGGDINFDSTIINEGNFLFRRFSDDQGSGENRLKLKSNFDFEIGDHVLVTDFKIDYLNGSFDRNYLTPDELNYGNFQLGFAPSYQMKQDNLTVDFGASFYYFNNTETSKNKFYIFPKFNVTYRLVDEILIAYGGIGGDLIQNSYYEFAQENPFVSPTLNILPTNQQYNGFIGLKGKLSNSMSYNLRGSYYNEKDKGLFKNNIAYINPIDSENYFYGNSFGVLYDDVTTLNLFGELNVAVNRSFTLGIKAEYFNYELDSESEAWNLPDFKGSLFMDYQIDKHWFMGANLFYVGERKDEFSLIDGSISTTDLFVLDSYFDANAHLGYKINDQFSVYAKANNIANQDYQRYLNFPVQSIQFLAGATYKFDF
ncbi:MAG: TonB-dependent receptor [Bacteroidia bacterium]|nr:TonB-dependent receptor [Bacteroidia bacterium]